MPYLLVSGVTESDGKLALAVTGLSHVPILTRPYKYFFIHVPLQ